MKKLEKLSLEKGIVSHLSLLPLPTRKMMENFYDREIRGIQKYGLENSEESIDSLVSIKRLIRAVKVKDLKEEKNNNASEEAE